MLMVPVGRITCDTRDIFKAHAYLTGQISRPGTRSKARVMSAIQGEPCGNSVETAKLETGQVCEYGILESGSASSGAHEGRLVK